MKKNNEIVNVINVVTNYKQAHAGARSIKFVASTLNQARKALGGIADEPIAIGKNAKGEKVYTTVGSFMETVGCPYTKGQVTLAAIKKAWAPYLKDKEGSLLMCKNVNKRVKIGKTTFLLYRKDENGDYKTVSVYQPAPVRDNGWDPYRICDGLAQSKFIDETKADCEASMAEYEALKANHGLYVHDPLTDKYVPVNVK